MCFSNILFFGVLSQKIAEREKNNDLKKHFLNQKPNAGYPTFAKPKRLKKKQTKEWNKMNFVLFMFFMFFTLCSLLFLFISCHVFSCPAFSFSWREQNITNPDHLHVDPLLLSFANMLYLLDQHHLTWWLTLYMFFVTSVGGVSGFQPHQRGIDCHGGHISEKDKLCGRFRTAICEND